MCRQNRLAGRAAAGLHLQGRDGDRDLQGRGIVSCPSGDLAELLVPRLGDHVQARGGDALRRRRTPRPRAGAAVHLARLSTQPRWWRPPSTSHRLETSPGVAGCSNPTDCHRSSASTSIWVGSLMTILRRSPRRVGALGRPEGNQVDVLPRSGSRRLAPARRVLPRRTASVPRSLLGADVHTRSRLGVPNLHARAQRQPALEASNTKTARFGARTLRLLLPEVCRSRHAQEVRNKPHFRSRSRILISERSVCADGRGGRHEAAKHGRF